MKFVITTVDYYQPEKVLKAYPVLEKFNFQGGIIEINSLEHLMELQKAVRQNLIVSDLCIYRRSEDNGPCIEIYDDYRE